MSGLVKAIITRKTQRRDTRYYRGQPFQSIFASHQQIIERKWLESIYCLVHSQSCLVRGDAGERGAGRGGRRTTRWLPAEDSLAAANLLPPNPPPRRIASAKATVTPASSVASWLRIKVTRTR